MGNYDVKRLRHITDQVDQAILFDLGFSSRWDDLELAYHRFMKMTRERHGTTRGTMLEEFEDDSE